MMLHYHADVTPATFYKNACQRNFIIIAAHLRRLTSDDANTECWSTLPISLAATSIFPAFSRIQSSSFSPLSHLMGIGQPSWGIKHILGAFEISRQCQHYYSWLMPIYRAYVYRAAADNSNAAGEIEAFEHSLTMNWLTKCDVELRVAHESVSS